MTPPAPSEEAQMGWATTHMESLRAGRSVQFRPRGNSMSGKIESGQLCSVDPVGIGELRIGDVVLCKVRGREYLHLVKAIQGARVLIGNNRGGINGWVGDSGIFGRLSRVE